MSQKIKNMTCLKLTLFIQIIVCISIILSAAATDDNSKTILRLMHTSDMYGSFAETSQSGLHSCSEEESKVGKCYGGFARIASVLRKARNSSTVLFLNSGNNYMGNELFSYHKEKIVTQFLELIWVNSLTFGIHDFDEGVTGLVKALESVTYFAPVACNLDLSEVPELNNHRMLRNSTYFYTDHDSSVKVGIIGYVNPKAAEFSNPGKIKFLDVVTSVREEIRRLRASEPDIKIIIVMGNSGFDMDKKIAEEVEDVDLIVGGNADNFFYNGSQPDIEKPDGSYPFIVKQSSGRKVYVAQSYAYTKYIGNLTLEFDNQGEITKIDGNLILLDKTVPKAEDVEEELQKWKSLLPQNKD